MKDFSKYSDEELVLLYKKTGDESLLSTLMLRYHNLVNHCAAPLFVVGAEREDLLQEGRLGLFDAFNAYDPSKNDNFIPFAKLCIQRALMKAVSAANRKKHSPLNDSLPLEYDDDDNSKVAIEPKVSSPEEIILDAYETGEMFFDIEKKLSDREKEVLLYLIEGYSYRQIANILNKSPKSIDNTIQRIRNKVSDIIKNRKNE